MEGYWRHLGCLSLFIFSFSLRAENIPAAPVVTNDIDVGRGLIEEERCIECHGKDGDIRSNNENSKVPKLAGQNSAYLLKQFSDFRSGRRTHAFMNMIAQSVGDDSARQIARYYAAQPAMRGVSNRGVLNGKNLYLTGDAARNILACAGCHGVEGRTVNVINANDSANSNESDSGVVPIIGGQDRHYLEQQLRDWRSGERKNSENGVMNTYTKALTDEEIESLADYISGL